MSSGGGRPGFNPLHTTTDYFAAGGRSGAGLDPGLEERFNRAMYGATERAQSFSTPSFSSLGGIQPPGDPHRAAYESLGGSDPNAYRAPPPNATYPSHAHSHLNSSSMGQQHLYTGGGGGAGSSISHSSSSSFGQHHGTGMHLPGHSPPHQHHHLVHGGGGGGGSSTHDGSGGPSLSSSSSASAGIAGMALGGGNSMSHSQSMMLEMQIAELRRDKDRLQAELVDQMESTATSQIHRDSLLLDMNALQSELMRMTQQCRSLGEEVVTLRARAHADNDEVALLREENRLGKDFVGGRAGEYIDLELEESKGRLEFLESALHDAKLDAAKKEAEGAAETAGAKAAVKAKAAAEAVVAQQASEPAAAAADVRTPVKQGSHNAGLSDEQLPPPASDGLDAFISWAVVLIQERSAAAATKSDSPHGAEGEVLGLEMPVPVAGSPQQPYLAPPQQQQQPDLRGLAEVMIRRSLTLPEDPLSAPALYSHTLPASDTPYALQLHRDGGVEGGGGARVCGKDIASLGPVVQAALDSIDSSTSTLPPSLEGGGALGAALKSLQTDFLAPLNTLIAQSCADSAPETAAATTAAVGSKNGDDKEEEEEEEEEISLIFNDKDDLSTQSAPAAGLTPMDEVLLRAQALSDVVTAAATSSRDGIEDSSIVLAGQSEEKEYQRMVANQIKVVESSERLVEAIRRGVEGVGFHAHQKAEEELKAAGQQGSEPQISQRAPDGIGTTLSALQRAGAQCGRVVANARDAWASTQAQCERDAAVLEDNWSKFQHLVGDFQRRCDGAEHSFEIVMAQLQHEQVAAAGTLELAMRDVVDVQRRTHREARKMTHYRSVLLDAQACVGDTRALVNSRKSKLAVASDAIAAGVASSGTVAAATSVLADAVQAVLTRSAQPQHDASDHVYVASLSDSWRLVNRQLELAQMQWDTALLRADILETNLENAGGTEAANTIDSALPGLSEEQGLLDRLKQEAGDAGGVCNRLRSVARTIEKDVRNCLAHTSQPTLASEGQGGQAAVDSLLKELSQHSLAGAVIAADAEDQLRVLQDLSAGPSQLRKSRSAVAPSEPQRSVSELMDELMTPALQGAFSEQTLQMIADQVQGL